MFRNIQHHLHSVNESYLEHFYVAWRYSFFCFLAAFAALIHGILPNMLSNYSSNIVKKLHEHRK